ncbi:MAG: ABC transporter ATP-binding protein [Chloroflexi bacterium]|nr:ABC transporter ATP-binding protein [Chloroflexota bacterium]MCH8282947.1 ABC transporter ATP-binding protein [Chloroflexota bacterium]
MNQIPEDAVVAARGVGREFAVGGEVVHAVRDVSLDIFPAEVVVLLGRSGSGKTTLLNLLGGLDTPTEGVVYLRGRDLSTFSASELAQMRRTDLGFVFQTFGLLPLLSAQENVELPLRIAGASRSERERLARVALDTVGLLHRVRHRPYELSGGEQQRVAIARAIVNKPPLILADEPTAELDSVSASSIFSLLAEIVVQDRLAVVVATHDQAVLDVAHRVLKLEDGALVSD